MKRLIPILLILFAQGCTPEGTPISVIRAPELVPQSQPDAVEETGIRQDPNTGGILLQWYKIQGVAGYKVFRSDTLAPDSLAINFSVVGDISVSQFLNDTEFVDTYGVDPEVRYYYYVEAYSSDQGFSSPSDTMNYTLLDRPRVVYPPWGTAVPAKGLYFEWYDHSGGGYAVIRLKDTTPLPPSYVWISKKFQDYASGSFQAFNFDGSATTQLVSGHSYEWRIERFNLDGFGRPCQGSTSIWSTFTIK
ncbi:MAG: hypothetical protein JRN15_01680 [Nitrososphaerota archaeon]|nr:hypothetical protein [Nitrososphaerota archaeon]